ncbi:MAG TPA: MFS transporter, partial [Gaiellaceae bacterium]|nr:MFS transporter [Gaiellaceae bacterium]
LIEANNHGWTSGRILGAFALAAVSLVAFVVLEQRQRLPMLDLSLFRSSTFAGTNTVLLLVTLAMFGIFFFVSLYMQNILGYSAVQAGAAFLPLTLLVVFVAPVAGKLSDRLGSRALMAIGMTLVTIELLYFSRLGVHESYWTLVPGMLLGGVGMPLVMTPTSAAALSGVPVDKAGVGSAVLNSSRQVGGSLGIALMGTIIAHAIGGSRAPEAFVHGFSVALLVAAAIAATGVLVALTTIRSHAGDETLPRSSDREAGTVLPIVQPSDATSRSGR